MPINQRVMTAAMRPFGHLPAIALHGGTGSRPACFGKGGRRRDGVPEDPGPAALGRVHPEAITSLLPDVVG